MPAGCDNVAASKLWVKEFDIMHLAINVCFFVLTGKNSPLLAKTLMGQATTYTDLDENRRATETYKESWPF